MLVLTLVFAFMAGAPTFAEDPNAATVEGYVTAIDGPNAFQVKRVHVIAPQTAQFLPYGDSAKKDDLVSRDITVGMYVRVAGKMDWATHNLMAAVVWVGNDVDRSISGKGVIDRVLSSGAEPTFRVDGYVLRITSATHVDFSGDLTALAEVGTNTWARFEGTRNDAGEVVATKAEFLKPKLSRHKSKISTAQVTTFPSGSMIDFDASFQTESYKHRLEDAGGWCGWYPVPTDAALQERVRRIGTSIVPKYQRELPDDDPAKIPFRFYAVEEKIMRADIFCAHGLVMITTSALDRLQNDDQLAAVLADGVAGQIQQQEAAGRSEALLLGMAKVAVGSAGYAALGGAEIGGAIVKHQLNRKLEDERGRIALGLLQDAGFDPWQAPEAWRMLAPGHLPKNRSKLKYPARSEYLLGFLNLQYKRIETTSASPASASGAAVSSRN